MTRVFFLYLLAAGFLLGQAWFNPAQAAAGEWQSSDYLQARLIGASSAWGEDETFDGAIQVKIAEGWHAYWRTPGDGGLAPQFDWENSTNVKAAVVSWPAPTRFTIMGLHSFGYSDAVAFPVTITPEDKTKPAKLALDLNMMVCHEICVPQFLTVTMDIPAGAAQTAVEDGDVRAARETVSSLENRPGLKINNMVLGPEALVITAFAQRGYDDVDLFVEIDDESLIMTAPPEITIDEDEPRQARLKIPAPEGWDNLMTTLDGKTITLTLTDGRQAVEQFYKF